MPAPRPHVPVVFQPDVETDVIRPEPELTEAVTRTTLSSRGQVVLILLSLLVIAIVCSAPVLTSDAKFLFRDDVHVTANPAVQHWKGLRHIWLHPMQLPSFSPIGYTAYLFETRMFGGHVARYHFVSLLLHAVNAMLLWTLLRRLAMPGAWLAAALFAANPVQVDAVAWIAQQRILLAAMFYLAALTTYLRYVGVNPAPVEDLDRRNSFDPFQLPTSPNVVLVLSLILFICAALTHAMVAVTWPVVAVIVIAWKRALVKSDALSVLPFAAIAVFSIALWINVAVFRQGASGEGFPTLVQCIGMIGSTLWLNLFHAIAPIPAWLSFAYAKPKTMGISIAIAGTVLAFAVVIMLWIARRKIGRGPIAAASLFAVLLLPFSGIVNFDWMRHSFIADHMSYVALAIPMIAIASMAWRCVDRRWRDDPPPTVIGFRAAGSALLVIILMVGSFVRAADYRDQRVLWTRVAERNPDSAFAQNMLGHYALNVDRNPRVAMTHFLRALESEPSDPTTHANLALAYERQGDTDKAIGQYFQALRLRPDDLELRTSLASAYRQQGDARSAMREFAAVADRATDRPPIAARALNEIALLQVEHGQIDEAIATFRRAIQLDPRFTMPRINLANQLYARGQIQQAADELTAVREIEPQNFGAFLNGGVMVSSLAKRASLANERAQLYQIAERLFRGAIHVDASNASAWSNLGIVLVMQSHARPRDTAIVYLNEAASCFRRVMTINPGDRAVAERTRLIEAERERASTLGPDAVYELPMGLR